MKERRRLPKGLVAIMLLICFMIGVSTNVLADAVIRSVRITVKKNTEFKYPIIEVPSNSNYEITNKTDWNKSEASLSGGDEIYCTITISPKAGYRFNLTNAITVSGASKRNVRKENDVYTMDIYYMVSGKLEVPQNVWWDEGIAKCEEIPNATAYEFRLYKNNSEVGSVKRSDEPEWDFRYELTEMTRRDKVKFKVRAINEYDSNVKASNYSTSENFTDWEELWYYYDENWWYEDWDYEDWENECYPSNKPSEIPSSYYIRKTSIYTNEADTNGHWVGSTNNWRYYLNDGEAVSGWIVYQRQWYYITNGGRMASGWLTIDGEWYYLSRSRKADFNEGAMYIGWHRIDGKWYYFYEDGSMATNTRIDNSRIGSDGSWIGDW